MTDPMAAYEAMKEAALRDRVRANSGHDTAGVYGENALEPGRCGQMTRMAELLEVET